MLPRQLELDSHGRRVVYVLRRDLTPDDHSSAWYEPEGGGDPAQATGNIWIRFREGEDAAARAADIERAGYRIARIPGYAPHGAFVRAGDVATALANLEALRAIGGVEVVEPELLKTLSHR